MTNLEYIDQFLDAKRAWENGDYTCAIDHVQKGTLLKISDLGTSPRLRWFWESRAGYDFAQLAKAIDASGDPNTKEAARLSLYLAGRHYKQADNPTPFTGLSPMEVVEFIAGTKPDLTLSELVAPMPELA